MAMYYMESVTFCSLVFSNGTLPPWGPSDKELESAAAGMASEIVVEVEGNIGNKVGGDYISSDEEESQLDEEEFDVGLLEQMDTLQVGDEEDIWVFPAPDQPGSTGLTQPGLTLSQVDPGLGQSSETPDTPGLVQFWGEKTFLRYLLNHKIQYSSVWKIFHAGGNIVLILMLTGDSQVCNPDSPKSINKH
ncbi:hypothetical protein DFH05DRAFT_1583934 [Lentinula detonsa]|uniref:Uncharacterized protein n=1 Tax=Lentinula detonsa TaxID=2804962 RepID=A0A9W8NSE5_9AGAR|nr:hypothetical protein DFH05DRAFT_1583934 [Lentinula detonsa]